MKKKGTGRSGVSGRARRSRGARTPSSTPAAPRKPYLLTHEHLAIVQELDRVFPELAPVVDLAGLRPGEESVDLVSQRLADVLVRRFEQPLFMAFCHLNSERLLDVIEAEIDAQAAPMDAQVVLADLFFVCFEKWFRRRVGAAGAEAGGDARPVTGRVPRPIYDALAGESRRLVLDRVEQIQGLAIPLPGMPFPEVAPARDAVARADSVLRRHACRIDDRELERWVACSLLALPLRPRRILHLRLGRGLPAREIADRLGTTPLGVLLEARSALVELDERILEFIGRFYGEEVVRSTAGPIAKGARDGGAATGSPIRSSSGKIIPLSRSPRGDGPDSSRTETDGDPQDPST